jgi:ketosteroid isomerase-like protein
MTRISALALCVACVACGSKKDPPRQEEAPAVAAVEDAAPDDDAGEDVDLTEAQVRAAIDAWLAAQNDGDLAAYGLLYDGEFTGVKRAGERTTRHNREEWLADRARMFAKKMTVTARSISVELRDGRAVVRFVQRWSSGSYADVGPKELRLVWRPAGLRIVREELFHSTVLSSKELVARCTDEDVERTAVARQRSTQLVVAQTKPLDERACDADDVTICLLRGKTVLDVEEIPGACVGACSDEAVAAGEQSLAEAEARVEAGETPSILDYDFTGCRSEGVTSSEFREAGGRTWALLEAQETGPHDGTYPTFRLVTALCDALFVSASFGGWPMNLSTSDLVLEASKDRREVSVVVDRDVHDFGGDTLYRLALGADDCAGAPSGLTRDAYGTR